MPVALKSSEHEQPPWSIADSWQFDLRVAQVGLAGSELYVLRAWSLSWACDEEVNVAGDVAASRVYSPATWRREGDWFPIRRQAGATMTHCAGLGPGRER